MSAVRHGLYDSDVPSNMLITTPGGVSGVHHHYTKGFNGPGNTSYDIYAGIGRRYVSGEYGNLYRRGHSAAQSVGLYRRVSQINKYLNE